jgi:hypothetical protein
MQSGARDFRTGDAIEWSNYFDDAIDVHHIFPQKWCDDNNISPEIYNSIINKTPLSARTNRMIGGRAPSLYIDTIRKIAEISEDKIHNIMNSHNIPLNDLLKDDYQSFFESRKEMLIQMIEKAMDKTIQSKNKTEEI